MNLDTGHHAHSNGSAASRTVAMFPALASNDGPGEPTKRDLNAEVRKLLANGAKLTRDEIQAELGAEANGEHVPLGQIAAALDEIGATVDSQQRWSLRSREDAEALAARRADVLEALYDFTEPVAASRIASEMGESGDDHVDSLDALVSAGAVERFDRDGDAPIYLLHPDTVGSIVRHGAEFVARATLPELTVPLEDRTAFERAATERFEAERAAKLTAQGERDKLATFLREKGVDPGEILHPAEPVVPTPKRDVFLWTKLVEVDDAVELEIAREERKLRAELALSQAALDAESGRHKGVKDRVNGRLKELEQAVIDKHFARQHEAYRVPVWEEGVTLVIKASDGSTILEREPIAKGTQRAIATEPSPSPKAASIPPADAAAEAADDAAQEQERRAADVRAKGGAKGEITLDRVFAEAEAMLRGFGKTGIEWGDRGDKAVNAIARRVHGSERGRLPGGLVAFARGVVTKMLDDGRAVQTGDALVWAECSGDDEKTSDGSEPEAE